MIVVLPSSLFAGIENRPLNSDEATVLPTGQFVIATGASFVRQPNNDNQWNWVTDFEYGMLDFLEVDVELPYTILDRHIETEKPDLNGLGDVAVWLEWNPLKETPSVPALSAAWSMKTHTGNEDRGLGTGKSDYTLTGLASKTFGSTSLHLNLGVTFVGDPPQIKRRDTFNYNLAIEHALTERLMLVAELYGQTNQDRAAEVDPLDLLGGFMYALNEHLTIDGGIGMGLTHASPNLRMTSGISLSF